MRPHRGAVILVYGILGLVVCQLFGVAAWLIVTTLLFANAVWHVVGSVKTRSYSPGVLTGLLL